MNNSEPPKYGFKDKDKIKDKVILQLFSLLDDIDTASDIFKPVQTNFYKYVMKKAGERMKYLKSNGYDIFNNISKE